MPATSIRYYFGRLNITASYEDKGDFLLDGMKRGLEYNIYGSDWGFFEADMVEFDNQIFIHGYLVKYKSTTDEEIVVRETLQIEDETVKNRVLAKSRFFLHIKTGIIAYHPVGGQINRNQFQKNFAEVFMENKDRLLVQLDISSIEQDQEIFDAIRRFTRIQEVITVLHPSNPDSRERWRHIDQRLRDLEAAKAKEIIEAKPGSEGLKPLDDEETKAKIIMANDGYGEASVSGVMDDEFRTVRTRDNPITKTAPNDENPWETVLRSLKQTFNTIMSRPKQ